MTNHTEITPSESGSYGFQLADNSYGPGTVVELLQSTSFGWRKVGEWRTQDIAAQTPGEGLFIDYGSNWAILLDDHADLVRFAHAAQNERAAAIRCD